MRQFITFGLMVAALLFSANTTFAQDKAMQAAILQKLSEIESRINDMDKRYEIRFTKLEERFNTVDEKFNRLEDKIEAVNQRIDDKFNLIVGLLGIIAAFLALPYLPKLLERFKIKNNEQKLQSEIDELKTQMAQLARLVQKPTL